MSKRGALESIAYEVVDKLITEVKPLLEAHSVTKCESGKSRLLLASELAHYSLQSLMALMVSRVYNQHDKHSHHSSSISEWNELAWRARITAAVMSDNELESTQRCYDFTDFNSQHTSLLLFVLYLSWSLHIPDVHNI